MTRVLLVVDDEPDILDATRDLLALSLPDVRILTARSGAQALALMERERIDVVLTDYKMPGMDGVALLERVRRASPATPRVLFTALADEELERRVLEAGVATAFLPKSLDPGEIVRRMETLVRAVRRDA